MCRIVTLEICWRNSWKLVNFPTLLFLKWKEIGWQNVSEPAEMGKGEKQSAIMDYYLNPSPCKGRNINFVGGRKEMNNVFLSVQ
jgi:hypothetical protein